ncbi:MAG: hypothetical protein ACYTG1_07370, partial [Planctomycetota bacterium]
MTAATRWRRLRPVGLLVGVLLLAAAVVSVARQGDVLAAALAAVRSPAPLPLAQLLVAVALNLGLTGLVFSVLIARYGRVGRLEMQALIASTALLNYLPLRPGLPGRLAYHRLVNGIPVVDAGRTVVEALALTVGLAGILAAALAAAARGGPPLVAVVPALAAGLAAAGLWPAARRWAWAAGLRLVDLVAWALRYHASFALLGAPIEADTAVALACVSVIATMVPLASNGLGLREWAIGLAAPLLTDCRLELGLTAELVNRAAELLVFLV